MRARPGLADFDRGHLLVILPGEVRQPILGGIVKWVQQPLFHVTATFQRMVQIPSDGSVHRLKRTDDVAIAQLMLELENIDHSVMNAESSAPARSGSPAGTLIISS